MRPRLIAEASLPNMRFISHVGGVGWLITQPSAQTVSILDGQLRVVTRVAVPTDELNFRASTDGQRVAVATRHDLAVVDFQGQLLWQRPLSQLRQGKSSSHVDLSREPECHLDVHGVLWVHLPPNDELVAVEAATGREIDRVDLETTDGGGSFLRHPSGVWTGLHVAMGQDGSRSWLTRLESSRISLRPLAAECLTGFISAGDRYFAMPHINGFLAVRVVATDEVVVVRHVDDIPGLEDQAGRLSLFEAAAVVSDDLVIVAVNADDSATDFEDHLLLSTRTMRYRSTVEYAYPMTQNSIYPADEHDQWLTWNYQDRTVRLWQIDGPLDDEPMPGQERLF